MRILGWVRDLIYKNRRYICAGNEVSIDPKALRIMKKVKIKVSGRGNVLIIESGADLRNCEIRLSGKDNRIYIGSNVRFKSGKIYLINTSNSNILLGDNTTVESAYLLVDEVSEIVVGRDCMLSTDIVIRTGDKHSILSLDTGKRINPAKSVRIGDHVWLGKSVQVLKGAIVSANTVVGANSVVTRQFDEPNCVLAGAPASIVKRAINWDRDLV